MKKFIFLPIYPSTKTFIRELVEAPNSSRLGDYWQASACKVTEASTQEIEERYNEITKDFDQACAGDWSWDNMMEINTTIYNNL